MRKRAPHLGGGISGHAREDDWRAGGEGLNVAEEISDGLTYGLCYAHQSFNGDYFFSAFDFTNVFRVQAHQFCECLLSHGGVLPVSPDCITN